MTKSNPTLYQDMQPFLQWALVGGVAGGFTYLMGESEGGFIVSVAKFARFGLAIPFVPIIGNGLERGLSIGASTLATYHATRHGGSLGKGQVSGVSLQTQPESPKKGDIQAPSGNIKKFRAGGKVYDLVFDRDIKLPKSLSRSSTKEKRNGDFIFTGDCSKPGAMFARKGQITGRLLRNVLRLADLPPAMKNQDRGKSLSIRTLSKRIGTDNYWLIRRCWEMTEERTGYLLVNVTEQGWRQLHYPWGWSYRIITAAIMAGEGLDVSSLPPPPLPRGTATTASASPVPSSSSKQ